MKRGDIYLVDLYNSKGHEQRGRRPALVMGEANGLTVVIPLTSNTRTARFSHTFPIDSSKENGLDSTSVILIFQIVSLDNGRLIRKIGRLSPSEMKAVDTLTKDLLGL